MPIVILFGSDFVLLALTLQRSAVFLTISTLDKRLSLSLAKGDISFAAVFIQGVSIHRYKSSKIQISCVHDGFDHGLQLNLSGGKVAFQFHFQFWYVPNKILQQ